MLFHQNVPVDSGPGLVSETIAAELLVTDIVPSAVTLIPLPILTPPSVIAVAVVNTNCETASTQVF